MEKLKEMVNKYRANVDRNRALDEKLFEHMEKEEWIEMLVARAKEIHELAIENEAFIEYMHKFLEQELINADYEELFEIVNALYWDGYEDYVVVIPMLEKLVDYYERENDIEKIILLNGILFYEVSEVRNRADGIDKMDTEYLYRIIELKDHYTELDESIRRRFFVAYYNLIVVATGNDVLNVDESYEKLQEMYHFWYSDQVQKLDGQNQDMIDLIETITIEWLVIEEKIEEASEDTQKGFFEIAETYYQKELAQKGDIYEVNSEIYAAYLHSYVLMGKLSFDNITDLYIKYYEMKLKRLPKEALLENEDFYFVINTPITLERWIRYIDSDEKKKKIVRFLKKATHDTWYTKLEGHTQTFINELLANWCFTLIKYLDTQEEKEEWIYRLLVRRQLPTYLHSVMVANLAGAVYTGAVNANPQLFANFPNVVDKDMDTYINKCALLHDVGKTRITDIVNMQTRRLSDREFQGIKLHTEYGAQMIDKDERLARFRDVVIGHHKFYDGTGGYPQNFDNTKSPYRIIIDLITICDCIDAATDCYGRNYKFSKTIDEVLEELKRDSGVRYNPHLVDIILNSKDLQEELRYITTEGRKEIMYKAYSEKI